MNVTLVIWGAIQKESELSKIIKKFGIRKSEIAYLGDDVNDVNIMEEIGLAACPSNANSSVFPFVDIISTKKGGEGCVRDIIEQVLRVQGKWRTNLGAKND